LKKNTPFTAWLLMLFLIPRIILSGQYYVLCEGNYAQANASLWSIDESLTTVQGPLIWDPASDPLGDVGQSMALFDHRLYLVMNNSHQIRIVDLENTPTHIADIDLSGASPRYLAIHRETHKGYVSSWNLGALLVIDLDQNVVIDTLEVNALPEDILIEGDNMYVSITMESDWTHNNEVWRYDLSLPEPTVAEVYTVIDGPGSLTLIGEMLYVTSIYYNDAWESFSGSSRINLIDHAVLSVDHGAYQNYSADVATINGRPFRTYGESIVPLNQDLSLDLAHGLANVSGIYAFAAENEHLLVTESDFVAPDLVHVFTASGVELAAFNVGALPGSFAYYDPDLVFTMEQADRPTSHQLGQNYPNPFNPSTRIPIFIQEAGSFRLDIIDIQGRTVQSLVTEDLGPGQHEVVWDGKDQVGRSMAGGVYYARTVFQGSSHAVKMSLIR
jgi:hypothetical protein